MVGVAHLLLNLEWQKVSPSVAGRSVRTTPGHELSAFTVIRLRHISGQAQLRNPHARSAVWLLGLLDVIHETSTISQGYPNG